MNDVSINIRGRDDGLSSMLDNIRDKAKQAGVDLANVNSAWENASGSQNKRDVLSNYMGSIRDSQADKIKSSYEDARNLNRIDFEQDKNDNARGSISAKEFSKRSKNFQSSQSDLNDQEQKELKSLDKDSNVQLRQIYRLLFEQDKRKKEEEQNNNSEFLGSGAIGGLKNEISELEKKKQGASAEDVALINREISEKKKQLSVLSNDGLDSDGNSRNVARTKNFIGVAGAAGSGDLVGTAQGAIGMIGGATAAIGAALIGAVVGFMFNGQKVQENLQQASSMRGFGMSGTDTNRLLEKSLTSQHEAISKLGKSPDELATMMGQKALASKVGGADLSRRTMDDYAFNKGFGADSGIFSQFERFNVGQKESSEIALDVLNTLTSIKESSLKEGDLNTLSEKLKSTETIMSIQRSKTDSTNSNDALRLVAGFESVGLSKKGEKGADFLSRTINGLGEGGDDNMMMLKYNWMAQAHPELAQDQAGLQRALKYKNTDPKYISIALKDIYKMSGNDPLRYQSMIYKTFGEDTNELDLEMYKKFGKEGGNMNLKIGGRNGTLTKSQSYQDANSSVGQMTQWLNNFQGTMQDGFSIFKGVLAPGGTAIKTIDALNPMKLGLEAREATKNIFLRKGK
jgi:hypothetical protein